MAQEKPDARGIRQRFQHGAPKLWEELSRLAEHWTAPTRVRLDANHSLPTTPKTFNDPIWGTIELLPWEVLLLDSPLLQRLRGVRQLGMAHQVYPSAGHDRLEHTRGVVEAAERILQSLERNAQRRRDYGVPEDRDLPLPSPFDRASIRLAALLHDIGHGPFSHASEPLIGARMRADLETCRGLFRELLPDATKIAPGELLAALLVLTEPLRAVFEHPALRATDDPARLAPVVAARILGSRKWLDAGYLSGVVSGPLDADKLDYMARDSYHAGLPVALDTNRLINKLEVVAVTPESVSIPALRARAEKAPGRRYYDVGISMAGLGAYEQMIVGRVILYDRLYYHHKVRAAEAMVQRLIEVAEAERGSPFTLTELFYGLSDDGMLDLVAGRLRADDFTGGGARARHLGGCIRDRDLHHRAYAVAQRFIAGLDGLPAADAGEVRIYRWSRLIEQLADPALCRQVEAEIHARGGQIRQKLADPVLNPPGEFPPEAVILDVALNKVVVRGGDILTRTEDGHLATPNLFFDPERWSSAYKEQKQCGFVFAPRAWVPLVALAARIVFYERFKLVMSGDADRIAKTARHPLSVWVGRVADVGLCSLECREALTQARPAFVPVSAAEIRLPDDWRRENAGLAEELAQGLREALPDGVLANVHQAVLDTINDLAVWVTTVEQGGTLARMDGVDEKRDLQPLLRDALRNRQAAVVEAEELGGGQVDLRVRDCLIVENKVIDARTADPFARGPHFVWQARRYALAVCSNVTFVVVAYRPASEAAIPPLSRRIRIVAPEGSPPGQAQIRVVVPFGQGVPHDAKSPPKSE